MKKIISALALLISIHISAQYPITSINISLPANPDANTANWPVGTSVGTFTISALAKVNNGRIDNIVKDSRILVTIKKGGAKICGTYTQSSAPSAGFSTANKVWNGTNAISLLGQDCILQPGDYEFCVQFFGDGAVGTTAISEEKCKTFTIRSKEQINYRAPQLLIPANKTVYTAEDAKKTMTFRWTPLVPKPQEPVTYRLKVWQIMQGQTGPQAMQSNNPVFEKEVENVTSTSIIRLINNSELDPTPSYIWTVQALNKEGKGMGNNNGMSETFVFKVNNCVFDLKLKLISAECLRVESGTQYYKICLSSTYNSSFQNLTFNNPGSGFKAYSSSSSATYTITSITPNLQTQSTGTNTVNYCLEVTVLTGQSEIMIGLQGDDTNPGQITCQPGAELKIKLPDCTTVSCSCGTWGDLVVQNAAGAIRVACGKEINWNCNKPFKFENSYICNPNDATCKAKIKWSVTKDGQPFATGNGAGGTFSPTSNGVYILTLNAECNGKKCPPCEYKIVVKDCSPPTCACGTWGDLVVQNAAGAKKNPCGSKIMIPCKQLFNFGNAYKCLPDTQNCTAKVSWNVSFNGTSVDSGSGVNGSFKPLQNGVYSLTYSATCNGKVCPPCTYTLIVSDCTPPSCFSFDNIGSIVCLGSNDSGGYNYQFSLTINNQTGSDLPSAVLSFSCISSFVLSHSTISQGVKTYTMTLSTHNSSITACCIKYNGYCVSEKCFDLPTCN